MNRTALSKTDKEIAKLIGLETTRQSDVLSMIPSENYASPAVREAVGSVLMNKYSEGQVGKRYYQGNSIVDEIEALCKKRALEAFGLNTDAWGVNVQALSGSPANLAVYNGLLDPGDTIMAMYLPDGGHLSHGWQLPEKKLTLVSKVWNIGFYHVDRVTRLFDYDRVLTQAKAVRPRLIISGGTAYPQEIRHDLMADIAHAVGAYYMADIAHEAGLVAAGVNSSPFDHADVVTMTTHKTLRGPRGALIFARTDSDAGNLMAKIDTSVFPGIQGGPHNHTIAGIAVALGEVMTREFRVYAAQVVKNASELAQHFLKADFDVVSGGTKKHLVLLDMRSVGVSAWVAAWALEYAGIVVNRNTVPYDTGSSFYPSGLRMGTPAITTRGMREPEIHRIAHLMIDVIRAVAPYQIPEEAAERKEFIATIRPRLSRLSVVRRVRSEVAEMGKKFPVP